MRSGNRERCEGGRKYEKEGKIMRSMGVGREIGSEKRRCNVNLQ